MTKVNQELLSQHHAVFERTSATTHFCVKDVFNHISIGSTISSQMLNCYLTIVPSAARIEVVECELYNKGEE